VTDALPSLVFGFCARYVSERLEDDAAAHGVSDRWRRRGSQQLKAGPCRLV